MRDAQRQPAVAQGLQRDGAVALARVDKGQLRADLGYPALRVGRDGGAQLGEAILGVVEMRYRLVESAGAVAA